MEHDPCGADGVGGDSVETVLVPVQRAEAPAAAGTGADVLRSLGLEALVQILERSAYGVCITGDDHTWLYVNPAAERVVGQPFEQLRGRDYLLSFPQHERAALLALEQDQRAGDTDFYTNTVVRPDGSEVTMTWSGSVVEVDGRELAPAFFHPAPMAPGTEHRRSGSGAGLGGGVREVLQGLAEEAVERTRAVGCLVLLASDRTSPLAVVASAGALGPAVEVLSAAGLHLDDLQGADLLRSGRVVPLTDDRSQVVRATAQEDRPAAARSVKVPLQRGDEVAGCLVTLLPPTLTAPTETELAFWSSLGSHASVALDNALLREQVALSAAELERQRLGRDLHDSVSQALFALHARAQVIVRALAADDRPLLEAAAADLEVISRQAVAEMRETLEDLRADQRRELREGLHGLVQRTRDREGLAAELHVPEVLPPLPATTAEHLLRIAGEALHNCVKHAGATRAVLRLEVLDSEVVLSIDDDGRGFDPSARGGAGHGRRTMRERAALCGGSLDVVSSVGHGTSVTVRVPLAP